MKFPDTRFELIFKFLNPEIREWLISDLVPKKSENKKFDFFRYFFFILNIDMKIFENFDFSDFFGIKSEILECGYIDVGDGCCRLNMLVTSLRCW